MNLLVSYDVNTETREGRRRLRRVAKVCEGFGQRVQFSVFEFTVGEVETEKLRSRLLEEINQEEDSLRIYRLAASRSDVVESYGRDSYVDFGGALFA